MCLVGEDFYIYDGEKWRLLQGKSSQGTVEVIKIKGEDQGLPADEVEINGTKYSTIEEAIQNASNNDTIILQKTVKNINIPEGKNINIDLNNINILNNEDNPVKINNNASLIISGDGCVECNKHGKASIENNGNTTIINGEYKLPPISLLNVPVNDFHSYNKNKFQLIWFCVLYVNFFSM